MAAGRGNRDKALIALGLLSAIIAQLDLHIMQDHPATALWFPTLFFVLSIALAVPAILARTTTSPLSGEGLSAVASADDEDSADWIIQTLQLGIELEEQFAPGMLSYLAGSLAAGAMGGILTLSLVVLPSRLMPLEFGFLIGLFVIGLATMLVWAYNRGTE